MSIGELGELALEALYGGLGQLDDGSHRLRRHRTGVCTLGRVRLGLLVDHRFRLRAIPVPGERAVVAAGIPDLDGRCCETTR